MWTGGSSEIRRASSRLEIITSVPVSARQKSALVIPTAQVAHRARNSSRSVKPERTEGSDVMPHSASKGAFEATAGRPSTTPRT